jgi:hypothetical protein
MALVRAARQVETHVPRGLGPIMPEAATVRLPYAYTSALANNGTYTWTVGDVLNLRVNNAYDPINGTHQPYGWDQMAALYRYYKVVGCSYKITGLAYPDKNLCLVVRPVPVNENLSIANTGLATVAERPGTKLAFAQFGGPIPSMSGQVNLPKQLGVSREQFDADVSEYSAAVTAAPSRYAYIQIGVCGTDVTSFMQVVIEVTYTVNYWQRITQAAS